MTTTVPANATDVLVPGVAADHADRYRKLQDERRFRLRQLAELDEDRSATSRHERVRKVLRTSAAAALAEVEGALTRLERRLPEHGSRSVRKDP